MPTMYEIYDQHAREYDELVTAEDYQGNLRTALMKLCDFSGRSVVELGTGTGRVTRAYIDEAAHALCLDRSDHMLQKAQKNLREYLPRITFVRAEHLEAEQVVIDATSAAATGAAAGAPDATVPGADILIEGWAFGHTVYDNPDNPEETIGKLVSLCERLVRPGGTILLIETMGTNVDEPCPPGELLSTFYRILEEDHDFQRTVISTDYRFRSVEEAARVMGFFFGPDMRESVERRGATIVPEYSGIWTKQRHSPGIRER